MVADGLRMKPTLTWEGSTTSHLLASQFRSNQLSEQTSSGFGTSVDRLMRYGFLLYGLATGLRTLFLCRRLFRHWIFMYGDTLFLVMAHKVFNKALFYINK